MAEIIDLTDIEALKKLLEKSGFTFSKSLGQNFIIDGSVCPQMAMMCGCEGEGVIEIGPGVGVLTRELSAVAKKVVTIELDKRLMPILSKTLDGCNNVEVIFGDAMKIDLKQLIKEQFTDCGIEKMCVCANLPYYITSPVIMMLLESGIPIDNITVMVQKEAAVRLCADMGTRECGAVSAAVAYRADTEILFDVGRESFMPPPKVDSSVIKLNLRDNPPVNVNDEKMFFRVIKAAFCMRRKTLNNSLSGGLSIPKSDIASAIEKCGLKPTARAEELTLQEFATLSDIIGGIING